MCIEKSVAIPKSILEALLESHHLTHTVGGGRYPLFNMLFCPICIGNFSTKLINAIIQRTLRVCQSILSKLHFSLFLEGEGLLRVGGFLKIISCWRTLHLMFCIKPIIEELHLQTYDDCQFLSKFSEATGKVNKQITQ